jgi:hypothetical protein
MQRLSSPPTTSSTTRHTLPQRRGSRRIASSAEITVVEPRFGRGAVLNVSAGGLRAALDCELRPDEICLVQFSYPDDGSAVPKSCRARVAWVREAGRGWLCGFELLANH